MPRGGDVRRCESLLIGLIGRGELDQAFRDHVEKLCRGAVRGLDASQFANLEDWASWLKWASVVLDENDYLTAAVYALALAPKLAATDYGTARQRDLGQLWTDAIRGFLGELAFVKWLREKFGVVAQLDYSRGSLEEFLPSDIREICGRPPRLGVSIKSTKLEGIWLDIPYAQVEESSVFVLVRVGVTREHFVAFLKKISVIRDKILEEAKRRGLIPKEVAEEVWNTLGDFKPIPAYVAGFLDKREGDLEECIRNKCILEVGGEVRGRSRVRVVLNKYLGFWNPKEERYKEEVINKCRTMCRGTERLAEVRSANIEFEGIGNFTPTDHFIASSGMLKKSKSEWGRLVAELCG